MDMTKNDIGKRVSSLRKRNGMTQENLAELLNCSVKHISHVERGTALLSLDKCVWLSDRTGAAAHLSEPVHADQENADKLISECEKEASHLTKMRRLINNH